MKYSLLFVLVLTLSVCVRLNTKEKNLLAKKLLAEKKKGTKLLAQNGNIATEDSSNCPDSNKPFYCKVNGASTCVASQIDCDCPSGYVKCNYMKYCVKSDREDMCPDFHITDIMCQKLGSEYKRFNDGICRNNDTGRLPNQRVCPSGTVLCPDLSCRKSHGECMTSEKCGILETRCADQSCVPIAAYCPSTVTCSDATHVVCPDLTCVANEKDCKELPECDSETPYLCGNSRDQKCVADYKQCPKTTSCGNGKQLCEDLSCKENCA